MRGRLRRASIAAVFLGTLVIPAVGSQADPDSLHELEREQGRTKRELAQVRDWIEVREAKAGALQAEADALFSSIVRLRDEVDELNADIAEVESQVRSVQARIDATQAKIDRIEELATEQAVALYKSGATDTLDALLDSRSLVDLDARIQMLGVAAQENTGALVKYGRLRLEIESQYQELFDHKRELTSKREERERSLADLQDAYDKHAAALRELEARLAEKHRHEGELEDQSKRLGALIAAAQARRAVENLGTSRQGFMWPLNGPITSYYGPRWGRMHTGIDIDGFTGQPVVASKAGRVILASSYSGYGYTVILDHGGGISTLYAHLSSFSVSSGETIAQAEVVGAVGCTGSCTGDHLHFEVRAGGAPVNPLDYLP